MGDIEELLDEFARMAVMHAAGVVNAERKDQARAAIVEHVARLRLALDSEQDICTRAIDDARRLREAASPGPFKLQPLPSALLCPGCGGDLNMMGPHNCPGRLDR